MLIAHWPSGYLLVRVAGRKKLVEIWSAIAGAMMPDLDMFYFHFVDHGQRHHHAYITHWPLFWIALWGLAAWYFSNKPSAAAINLFFGAAILHMVLDTWAGPIMWLAPFSWQWFQLFEVPAMQSNWVLSFILHWTFLLELAICLAAFAAWLKHRRSGESMVNN